MGMGCTRELDRVCAAVGLLSQAPTEFEACLDVPNGGVLCALPALLENGLLRHTEAYFQLADGYYGCDHIFLLLAMMALARVRSVEQLRYHPAGEWGKLLGLDRIPTEADPIPNSQEGTLTVRLHHLTNRMSDQAAQFLADTLNKTETICPGTGLRLTYKLVSNPDP